MKQAQVFWSHSNDPYLNASHEEWIYNSIAPEQPVFFFWQNRETVCIGRYQNPWSELNMKAIQDESIPVIRRISGGGTVFHDLGNLNVSYMHPGSEYDKKIRMLPVIDHLKNLGNISLSERGDGLIQMENDTYKFSGSAFKNRHHSSLHHFTLLLNSDLNRLWKFIRKEKSVNYEGRSQPSTRMPVRNLNIESPKIWAENWATQQGLSWTELNADQLNQTFLSKNKSHDWVYAETPDFLFWDGQKKHSLNIVKGKIVGENGILFPNSLECQHHSIDALRKMIKGEYSFEQLFG